MTQNHYAEITQAKGTVIATSRDNDSILAEATTALKLQEHHFGKVFPPVFYIRRDEVDFSNLVKNEGHSTHCPIKGDASYYSLQTEDGLIENIAWSYEDPLDHVAEIKDHLAFDGKLVEITQNP